MKHIKVLGTGCANCKATLKLIDAAAKAKGIDIKLEKIEAIADILGYGVTTTPAVIINGRVVHTGGVPNQTRVEAWLTDHYPA